MNKRVLWIVLLAAVPAAAQQRATQTQPQRQSHAAVRRSAVSANEMDEHANSELRRMSDYLAGLRSFRVDSMSVDEVVTQSGQKIQMVAQSRVAVLRPNHVRSDRIGPVANVVFRYDGNTFSLYGNRTGYYATAPAPATLDAAIDAARDRLGLELPAADLLLSHPYEALMDGVRSSQYVGMEPIDGVNCHHLAFRGDDVDWQIWVQDGAQPVPRRFVITSKTVQAQPEFSVHLTNWDTNAQLSSDLFTFQPPPGSTRIEFLPRANAGARTGEGTR